MNRAIFWATAAAALALSTSALARVSILPLPPQPVGDYVWVPPVYRVELERVWVADRVEQITERYWVAAAYGWRTVIYCDESGRQIVTREWGETTPGHWETRTRDVAIAGHYETSERRILVSGGYWQYVGPRPLPLPYDPPIVIQPGNPGTVGVDGFAKDAPSDQGKFSPLYEWPK